MRRIPPSLTMKEAISTLLQTGTPDGHPLDALVRASARYMLQVALEQEVTDFLGRAHYQRGARRQAGEDRYRLRAGGTRDRAPRARPGTPKRAGGGDSWSGSRSGRPRKAEHDGVRPPTCPRQHTRRVPRLWRGDRWRGRDVEDA